MVIGACTTYGGTQTQRKTSRMDIRRFIETFVKWKLSGTVENELNYLMGLEYHQNMALRIY